MGGADQPRTRDQLRSARVIPQTDADGKYLIWMSCRLPPLSSRPQDRTTARVLQELDAPATDLATSFRSTSVPCQL